jgi:hypothetical protein
MTDRDKRLIVIGDHARAILDCLKELPGDTDLPGHLWRALDSLRAGAETISCSMVFRD